MTLAGRKRLRIHACGAVQGVGFRPFVFRLARELHLTGWVLNNADGLSIDIEGAAADLDQFLTRLKSERPKHSVIRKLDFRFEPVLGYKTFDIRQSDQTGQKSVQVLPDLATCVDCLNEISTPDNRRYRYPFTNCTHCGPRFSIVEELPYDRANTTLRQFRMCEACRQEYENQSDRRFHAQPIACPACGPQLALWDAAGATLAVKDVALRQAAAAISSGKIVALKGLGGFQLLGDARNDATIQALRARKRREDKPLALMIGNLHAVKCRCCVDALEERLLLSPAAPIVLLQRGGPSSDLAPSVAPDNPYLGVMLPYTPLHALLMEALNFPVVATSGNLSEEPICIDEQEALDRLRGIADLFLVHDRPIARHLDDSVVRVVAGKAQLLRAARGYAPLDVALEKKLPPVLAVGGHLKNTVAVTAGESVILSQHIGDLETRAACMAFTHAEASLRRLYEVEPQVVACDEHPDYFSTQQARKSGGRVQAVQHHHAHAAAAMAEHGLDGEVFAVAWDGSGYGPDGTIWGGEFLLASRVSFRRVGHLRTFRLPGGEQAVREPRRSALGVLYEIFGNDLLDNRGLAPLSTFSEVELRVLRSVLEKKINAPLTSSAGRLIDAVASLLDLKQKISFEGQAAMALEHAAESEPTEGCYAYRLTQDERGVVVLDWEPTLRQVMYDYVHAVPVPRIASKFLNALVEMMVGVAKLFALPAVVLCGGCFQNKYLVERAAKRFGEGSFKVYWPQNVPPNDGGLALGQAVVVAAQMEGRP